MNDRQMEITLMIFFSVIGAGILTLGWVRPLDGDERTMVSLIGAAGIIGTLVRLLLTRSQRKAAVRVNVNDDQRK